MPAKKASAKKVSSKKACSSSKYRSSTTGRCIKRCKVWQKRSSKTGRCINRDLKGCRGDQRYDGETKRCRMTKPARAARARKRAELIKQHGEVKGASMFKAWSKMQTKKMRAMGDKKSKRAASSKKRASSKKASSRKASSRKASSKKRGPGARNRADVRKQLIRHNGALVGKMLYEEWLAVFTGKALKRPTVENQESVREQMIALHGPQRGEIEYNKWWSKTNPWRKRSVAARRRRQSRK